MITKVAISVDNADNISGHAGKCQRFFVYDVHENNQFTKSTLELTDDQTIHNSLHSGSSDSPILQAGIILTQSIGQEAIVGLAQNYEIAAYMVKEENPDVAIDLLIKGQLQAYAPDQGHHGHGGCGCGSGCGCH